MSTQTKVISSITKTENSFKTNDGKDMFQYDVVFENDNTTYASYSPSDNYLVNFGVGTSVEIEANPSNKMPNKIKMKKTGASSNQGGYQKKSYNGGSSYSNASPTTNKYILYNVVSEAVIGLVLSAEKCNATNASKYTNLVVKLLNDKMEKPSDKQYVINLQRCLKSAAKFPACRDAHPSVLVDNTFELLNEMIKEVEGEQEVKVKESVPQLEPDFFKGMN